MTNRAPPEVAYVSTQNGIKVRNFSMDDVAS